MKRCPKCCVPGGLHLSWCPRPPLVRDWALDDLETASALQQLCVCCGNVVKTKADGWWCCSRCGTDGTDRWFGRHRD